MAEASRRAVRTAAEWAPGLGGLADYRWQWLRADVLAALTIAAIVLPQSLAFGELAGVPAVCGLYAAVAAMLVYGVLGPSRTAIHGPDATVAVVTAAAIGSVGGGPGRALALAGLIALLVGGITFLAGVARAGFLAELLSAPVLLGFRAGAAALIVVVQVAVICGLDVRGAGLPALLSSLAGQLQDVRFATVAIALVGIGILLYLPRRWPRAPAPLIMVLACALLVPMAQLQRMGLPLTAAPAALPLALPAVGPGDVVQLLPTASLVALMALTDAVRAANSLGDADPDRELITLGLCNAASGVAHGMPVTISQARSEVAVGAGAKGHVAGLLCAGLLAAGALLFSWLLGETPSAVLAVIVILAAARMVDASAVAWLWRHARAELALTAMALAAVLAFGILVGACGAIALSGLVMMGRLARAHVTTGRPDEAPDLLLFRYDAPVCFASAGAFERRLRQTIDRAEAPVRSVVVDVAALHHVDAGTTEALSRVAAWLGSRDIALSLAGATTQLRDALSRSGLADQLGADNVHSSVEEAISDLKPA